MKRTVIFMGSLENIQRTIEMLDQLSVEEPKTSIEIRPLTPDEEDTLAAAVEEYQEVCIQNWRLERASSITGVEKELEQEKEKANKLVEIWSEENNENTSHPKSRFEQ